LAHRKPSPLNFGFGAFNQGGVKIIVSYDLSFAVNNDVFSVEKYKTFLKECSKIKGKWKLKETFIIDDKLGKNLIISDDYDWKKDWKLHQCNISNDALNESIESDYVNIWIDLNKSYDMDCYFDNLRYSRYVSIETGSSRSLRALAIQFLIPIKAFNIFNDIIVFDESNSNLFCNKETYKEFVKEQLFGKFKNAYLVYYLYLFTEI
jgi:hypothetical protein